MVYCKSDKGGGTKQIKLPTEVTKPEILDVCVKYFWEKRIKHFFKDSHFLLADYRHENLSDIIENDHGDDVPFTLGAYCSIHKMTRPRIYFRTKPKTAFQQLSSSISRNLDLSDDDDFQAEPSTSNSFASSTLLQAIPSTSSSSSLSLLFPSSSTSEAVLIPSSAHELTLPFIEIPDSPIPVEINNQTNQIEERRELIRNQDEEYQNSLWQDMKKDEEKKQEEEEHARLELLRQARAYRVEEESKLEEEHVVVAVRHPHLKTQTRFFKPSSQMPAVYDWIGSLSIYPEHYQLYNAFRVPVSPDYNVEAGVYNMRKIESPLLMSPNGTVAFQGYGVADTSGTSKEINESNSPEINKTNLIELREEAFSHLKEDVVHGVVDRENIYDTLLQFYAKEKSYDYQRVTLTYDGEDAIGDGVAKDAFSQFFNGLEKRWEGCREIVPSMNRRPRVDWKNRNSCLPTLRNVSFPDFSCCFEILSF